MSKVKFKIKKYFTGLAQEISSNKLVYLLLLFILFLSAFLRLYKLDKLLGFWYDQGRDALVIWDLIHQRNFFLVGPVTGIENVFRGPAYYYLIAPFYWLGKGSPAFVAGFLACFSVLAIYLIFLLASEIYGKEVGLLSALIYGVSYEIVTFSRWLSNPNPAQFFVVLAMICLYRAITGRERYLVFAGFLLGLCLHFETAVEVFYPMVLIFVVLWQNKKLLKCKLLLQTLLAFFATLIPQLVFNFRYHGILFKAFEKFLVSEKSFKVNLLSVVFGRVVLYYNILFSRLLLSSERLKFLSLCLILISFIVNRQQIFKLGGKFLLAFLIIPLLGLLFYQGNQGRIWDYYFFSLLPGFVILFSAGFYFLFKNQGIFTKSFLILLLVLVVNLHLRVLASYYKTGSGITLQSQLKAIDWIYQDAGENEFNVDFYVPPKIFYSYTYLFRWYGKSKYGREPVETRIKLLYTLSEPDSWNPNFLSDWYKRQDGIGKVTKKYFWGDLSVERRERVLFYD